MMGYHMAERTRIKQGQLYWVDAEPHAGHEEGGHSHLAGNIRRPVVVVSNEQYNQSGMAIVFPVTSKKQHSRYLLPVMAKRPSSIILTQVLGYDMIARNATDMGVSVSKLQLDYLRKIIQRLL